ncbi:MAG TPA: oxygenase MpaB family protein [Solirubrobacteraceae bacterium]|nr:oxygenase MpaB family protein [Solirubrobacteraceae bacterium]
MIWRVITHPVTSLMAFQTSSMLEIAHRHMQAVILGHDRGVRAAIAGNGHVLQILRRVQRTVGVPMPILLGDTPTADRVASHLRRFHGGMTGVVPGSHSERYDAGSPELVVFAHVTIFHAFLRNYEALAFGPGRRPARLPQAQRDRYFQELVPFAELMGVPRALVPDSTAAVADYYAAIAGQYGEIPGHAQARPAIRRASLRAARRQDLPLVPLAIAFTVSQLLALAIVPRPVRRLLGIPAALDPALAAALAAARPGFAPLVLPTVGDRLTRTVAGPDALRLIRAARATMASPREPVRELAHAA